jgi:hypothetical protein
MAKTGGDDNAAVAAGSLLAAGIHELRDALRGCPGEAEATAVSPQAHAAQMALPGKPGSAILNDPGLAKAQFGAEGRAWQGAYGCQ